jgi:hypothetical protein
MEASSDTSVGLPLKASDQATEPSIVPTEPPQSLWRACHTRRSIAAYLFKPAACLRKSCFADLARAFRLEVFSENGTKRESDAAVWGKSGEFDRPSFLWITAEAFERLARQVAAIVA